MDWLGWCAVLRRLGSGRLFAREVGTSSSSQDLGRQGERWAAWSARRRGWRVVARNVHTPFGEIDLVAWDGKCVWFAEVKTRTAGPKNSAWGQPGAEQVERLVRAAQWYRARYRLTDRPARMALCQVSWRREARPEVVWWLDPWEENDPECEGPRWPDP
ncbi:MAG: hypothetical protein KatS3mg110_4233 [Pirellulaceae bacterium]|nr:MAG: hypothetical protein KatS3mg110_4233 [Pirellulaceae bacterium]